MSTVLLKSDYRNRRACGTAHAGMNDTPQSLFCHPERAKRVEGSSHLPSVQKPFGAKILRLRASLSAQDDKLLNRSNPTPIAKEKSPTFRLSFFFWQRMRDSNPRERSQSPVCYRYTNPLSTVSDTWLLFSSNMAYYTQLSKNVKYFFQISQNFFQTSKNTLVGVGVLDDPSEEFDLDGQILPQRYRTAALRRMGCRGRHPLQMFYDLTEWASGPRSSGCRESACHRGRC